MAIAIPALPRPRRARCLTSCEKPTLHIGRSEHVVKRLHIPSSYEGAGNNYFRASRPRKGSGSFIATQSTKRLRRISS